MLTIWKLKEPVACKDWSSSRSGGRLGAAFFDVAEKEAVINPITDLESIYNTIMTTCGDRRMCPVYGISAYSRIDANKITNYENFSTTYTNHFIIDVDNLELEGINHLSTMAEIGHAYTKFLHEKHPEYFDEDLGFVIVASGSMWGVPFKPKFHIHLIMEEPATIFHMKGAVLYDLNDICADKAIYTRARTILSAPPVNSNLPGDKLIMRNRVAVHYGKGLVRGIHEAPFVESVQSYSPQKCAELVNKYFSSVNSCEPIEDIRDFRDHLDPLNRVHFQNNVLKMQPDSETFIQDDGNVPVRSNVGMMVRSPHLFTRSHLDDFARLMTSQYIAANHKNKDQLDYLSVGLNNAFRDMPLLMRDVHMDNNVEITHLNPNENGKLDLLGSDFGQDSDTIYFLKASMGIGKTYNIKRMLEEGELESPVLVIAPLRAIAAELGASMGLTDYRDDTFNGFKSFQDGVDFQNHYLTQEGDFGDWCFGKTRGVCTVINSLVKDGLQYLLSSGFFRTIVIDEGDAALKNLVDLVQGTVNQRLITNGLSNAVKQAKSTIIMDGDISDDTIECYRLMFSKNWKYHLYTCINRPLEGVPVYSFLSEESIIGTMLMMAQEGKRILLVSDQGPSWVETVALAVKDVCDAHVVTYHSGVCAIKGTIANMISNPPSYLKQEMMDNDVNTSMSQYILSKNGVDILIASPSMVAAQDFVGYFDVVVSINKESYGIQLRMQAIARERKPKTILYYIDTNKLTNISYQHQYKPFLAARNANGAALIRSPDDFLTASVVNQYNMEDVVDRIALYKESRKVLEQYSYAPLTRMLLIERGATIYEVSPQSELANDAVALYNSLFTQEKRTWFTYQQRVAIISGVPSVYASEDFIEYITKAIADFFPDADLTDEVVEWYLNNRPDLKGRQLKALQDSNCLNKLIEILAFDTTYWWQKRDCISSFFLENARELNISKVMYNHANPDALVRSIGLKVPSGNKRSKCMSLIPKEFDPHKLIAHYNKFNSIDEMLVDFDADQESVEVADV